MRRTSRKERRFEVSTACCLTAALSSALSCSPTGLGSLRDAAVVGLRYRAGVDIVVVGCEADLLRVYVHSCGIAGDWRRILSDYHISSGPTAPKSCVYLPLVAQLEG